MNDKVKAIFFAQYLYQDVVCVKHDPRPFPLNHIQQGTDEYLLLRSINDLTDEELVAIATMSFRGEENHTTEIGESIARSVLKDDACFMNPLLWTCVVQYLLRIGIALPFTFLNDQNQPETYSVENLVELGWVMIKTNN